MSRRKDRWIFCHGHFCSPPTFAMTLLWVSKSWTWRHYLTQSRIVTRDCIINRIHIWPTFLDNGRREKCASSILQHAIVFERPIVGCLLARAKASENEWWKGPNDPWQFSCYQKCEPIIRARRSEHRREASFITTIAPSNHFDCYRISRLICIFILPSLDQYHGTHATSVGLWSWRASTQNQDPRHSSLTWLGIFYSGISLC